MPFFLLLDSFWLLLLLLPSVVAAEPEFAPLAPVPVAFDPSVLAAAPLALASAGLVPLASCGVALLLSSVVVSSAALAGAVSPGFTVSTTAGEVLAPAAPEEPTSDTFRRLRTASR